MVVTRNCSWIVARQEGAEMGRPRKTAKKPQTKLEKLEDEIYRLRAENALLKKVKALVEEKYAREQGNGL